MNYQKLSEFRFLRDTTIIFTVKETGISIQNIIQMPLSTLPKYKSYEAQEIFQEYLEIRKTLFQKEGFLFVTDETDSIYLINSSKTSRGFCVMLEY